MESTLASKHPHGRVTFSREYQNFSRNLLTGSVISDNLDLIQIQKFKNSVSVSDDQCLQYVRKQCVSSEDIIFTVHIGYDYL